MHFFINFFKLLLSLRTLLLKAQHAPANEIQQLSTDLRLQLVSMGATFIKFGQILSMRYDFLPRITCEELQKLLDEQDKALSYKDVQKILKNEFGKDAEQLHSISQEPIAVASLAQVHTAYLAGSNQKLAIKIQKPKVREQIESDIKSINQSLILLKILPGRYRYTLTEMLSEFADWTLKELDFTLEGASIEKFGHLFTKNHKMVPLTVFRKFSNNKILTTDFIEGKSAKKIMQAAHDSTGEIIICEGQKFNRNKTIKVIEQAVFDQIFVSGFIHGDPHPSNMILVDDGHIAFLDFGIAMQLNAAQQAWFKDAVYHIACNQKEEVVKDFIALDERPGRASDAEMEKKMAPILDKLETSLNEEYSSSQFLLDLLSISMSLDIQLPKFLGLLAKAIFTYDGIVQTIKPDSNLMKELLPFFEAQGSSQVLEMGNIKEHALKSYQAANDLFKLATELPGETLGLLKDVRSNGFKLVDSSRETEVKIHEEGSMHSHEIIALIILVFAVIASFFAVLTVLGPESYYTWTIFILLIIMVLFSIYYLMKK